MQLKAQEYAKSLSFLQNRTSVLRMDWYLNRFCFYSRICHAPPAREYFKLPLATAS